MPYESVGDTKLWILFIALVLGLLALDLIIFERGAKEVKTKSAVLESLAWIGLACIFNAGLYVWFGPQKALEFTAAYLLEKSLSVDNLFVFLTVLSYFAVPPAQQHRVLFFGVLGAIVLRGIFIGLGAVLLTQFAWITYVFGGILLFTGVRMLFKDIQKLEPDKNPVFRLLKRVLPLVTQYHEGAFTIVENGKRFFTPLFMVLVFIEITDLVFAVDSIPAVYAVSPDPFIVFTSNIFAILGLRSLFFLLAGSLDKFHRLQIGLALVLLFVGGKMMAGEALRISTAVSLGVVAFLIGGSVLASLLWPRPKSTPSAAGSPSESKP